MAAVCIKSGNIGAQWSAACRQAVADLNHLFRRKGVDVTLALNGQGPVIGVATGNASLTAVGESNGVRTGGFREGDGPTAAPGGYLTVIVQGLVRATAADASLQPGDSVAAGANGVVAAASGGLKALSAVDGDGMVWVMLGGQ